MENLSQNWWVIVVALAAVAISVASYAVIAWLAQRQRTAALAAIEAAYRAGKEPDPALLKLLAAPASSGQKQDPWTNVWTFAALTVGFGYGAWQYQADADRGTAFSVVALVMGLTFIASLVAALRQRKVDGSRRDA